jgi:membrane protease subunit (stomatin/prohibitin family)
MGILDSLKRQLRSVIEWETAAPSTLFEAWSTDHDEIKNASKLLLKPGQGAIFLHDGKVAAVHTEPGLFELATSNIPFLTTISRVMQAFESEHKVGIYFFWQTEFLSQKWGTTGPVKYTDPVYKFPVGLRAFGNFSYQLAEPQRFFSNIVGSRTSYTIEDASRALSQRFMQPLTDLLATSSWGYVEIDKHRSELADQFKEKLIPIFAELGFTCTDVRIEHTDFDPETHERISRIANAIADTEAARAAGLTYAQMQQLGALRDAARNEGGLAGIGASLGAGLSLAQTMSDTFKGSGAPAVAGPDTHAERLRKLKVLRDEDLISADEYEKKRQQILNEL